MSDAVGFTVIGTPKPAGSKYAAKTKDGRVYVRDASASRGGTEWRKQVAETARRAMGARDPLDGPLFLVLRFYVGRPKGHFGRRGLLPNARPYPTTRPDLTKLVRSVEDACTGIVWRDDSQVIFQTTHKEYGSPARVELAVTPLTLLGFLTGKIAGGVARAAVDNVTPLRKIDGGA